MTTSATKCAAFQIRHIKDSLIVADLGLVLRSGKEMPNWGPGTSLSYLGVVISPWTGIHVSGLRKNLASTLQCIKKLALKPQQKVDLNSKYLVPHYLYQLVEAVPANTLP
jgi:hypothetical protein